MRHGRLAAIAGVGLLALTGCAGGQELRREGSERTVQVRAASLPLVRTIDERFQSFQLGFSYLTGGDTWVSYDKMTPEAGKERQYTGDLSPVREPRAPTDLSNPRFRKLVSALAPLYIRYGGTTTNTVYFQDNGGPKLEKAPEGHKSVLTRKRWREALEFADAVGAKIYTGFSVGHGVRNKDGVWTPVHAKAWFDYNKSIGGEIYAAELFNEPNMEGHSERLGNNYDAKAFARDYAIFREFITKADPHIKLVGPSDVETGGGSMAGLPDTEGYLAAEPRPKFDIISYHFYPAIAERCAGPDSPRGIRQQDALSEEYLARQDGPLLSRMKLRDRFAPGAPIWNTETGGAACGGTRWQTRVLSKGWWSAVETMAAALACGYLGRMSQAPSPFRYFHSSPEVIRLVVMMYVRFPLSLRNVEDLLYERGIDLCHETVRLWWNRFGPMFAADIRRQRVSRMRGFRHWKWHADEVYVKINGELHYLWRAVDHEGEILESYVTKKRDKAAALRFFKKTLKRHGSAEKIVTDGLRSYPAAMSELGNLGWRETGRHLNNRAENSHLPFRRRERAMLRFRRMKSLQKFASVHASLHNHFNSERHLVDRQTYKLRRSVALAEWQSLAG